jgi:hypothetical protein
MRPASLGWSVSAGALGLGLITALFLLTGVSFASLVSLISRLNIFAFAGIVVCSFVYVILGAAKWRLISGVPAPRAFFYTHFMAQAMLISQFLPPPVAIAASRAAVMKIKQKIALKRGFLNAVYDMGFDFLIALLLVPISFLQLFYRFNFSIWLLSGSAMVIAAACLLIFAAGFLPAAWLAKFGLEDLHKNRLLSPRLITLLMFLSAARFTLVIVRLALGAIALGIVVPFATVAYAAPPATMSSLLFLTPANLGIAEWSWAYLLALWGVPAAVGALYGTSFRILVFVAQLLVSGVCWMLYALAGNRAQ